MNYEINGFADIYTILSNERRVGGAIEAESIQLRSGEVFKHPVVTNIDFTGSTFYTISFISDTGLKMIVNVNEIRAIVSPAHKRIKDLKNSYYKNLKVNEKLKYLNRLCEVNEGCYTEPFVQEVKAIINDIGLESVGSQLNIDFLRKKQNVVQIA
ncbi:hypothetical protein [Thermoflavimicrobium dichotomicum]|uniref:Uncharacterized protein n=1 Tax=Thermoflavimicrobium dichotomicum TaxID=46223 RepID=A0A1I3S544_9BACL|nr:hypothetical protein [Thermoflavimicrobium dichotomicum]SFJ53758.1 hypothetical protein SAMN05421852_11216 [Thermoflavimicrobium dichotomicum]